MTWVGIRYSLRSWLGYSALTRAIRVRVLVAECLALFDCMVPCESCSTGHALPEHAITRDDALWRVTPNLDLVPGGLPLRWGGRMPRRPNDLRWPTPLPFLVVRLANYVYTYVLIAATACKGPSAAWPHRTCVFEGARAGVAETQQAATHHRAGPEHVCRNGFRVCVFRDDFRGLLARASRRARSHCPAKDISFFVLMVCQHHRLFLVCIHYTAL